MKYQRGSLIFLLIFPLMGFSLSVETVRENEKGIEQLKEDNPGQALEHFVQGLSKEPFNGALHNNIGLALEKNEDKDKALKEFMAATRSKDLGVQFQAHFNAGRIYSERQNKIQALKHYQAALELLPDSKEVKTNIELLMAKGSGQGEGSEDKKNKDQKSKGQGDPKEGDQDEGEDKKDNKSGQKGHPPPRKPKPFKSKELSKNDVRKILEEIKNQEQKIRAKELEKGAKEKPRAKDW